MKSDLDRLMEERGFDAFVVIGDSKENHPLHYLTGGAPVSHGTIIKKRGDDPVLIVHAMERDEAAKSGLKVMTTDEFDYMKLLKEAGNFLDGELKLFEAIFKHFEIAGTVSFYGTGDPGSAFVKLSRLAEMLPEMTITGEAIDSIFDVAFATKDPDEMAAIRSVAERTNKVMGEVLDFVKEHKLDGERLVKEDGSALTIGDTKGYLQQRLLNYGLEDLGDTIFAAGRDAGVPHSRGEDDDELVLGKAIIFDLFPRELGGGYFHDMTRTICLGYAPPEVKEAYDHVMYAFHQAMEALTVGGPTKDLQELTSDILEQYGHPTTRSHPGTTDGYVHSLGHGLGLQIHSAPRLSVFSDETLEVGQVITIEPGVYYPEKGYGVRIEDTVYIGPDGAESLTPYPKDLVLEIEGAPERS